MQKTPITRNSFTIIKTTFIGWLGFRLRVDAGLQLWR